MKTVEDIILSSDQRGISSLRKYLHKDFCTNAALTVLDNPGTAIIVTGFYIRSAGYIETDGPPGAIVIGRALIKLGYKVVYVTDQYGIVALETIVGPNSRVYEFPILDFQASKTLASNICNELDPSIVIAVERCGVNELGEYSNMHGQDITQYTAKIDCLFQSKITSIGIGDGGNEIGMGNLFTQVKENSKLVSSPTTVEVDELIIASVSNWGAYGLVAAISLIKNQNLLVSVEEEKEIIHALVGLGVVDGMSGKAECFVDGFDLDSNSKILQDLHSLLN